MSAPPLPDMDELLQRLLDDQIEPDEMQRLGKAIREDPRVRDYYVDSLVVSAVIRRSSQVTGELSKPDLIRAISGGAEQGGSSSGMGFQPMKHRHELAPAQAGDGRVTSYTRSEAAEAARRIEELVAGEKDSLIKVLLLSRTVAESRLVARFRETDEEAARRRLAKGLAWFGNPLGNALLLEEMQSLFAEEQASGALPWEYYRQDQNTPYWTINQDLALLGLSGDHAVLPAVLALADGLKLGNPPVRQETQYNRGRIDLRLVPYYNRIINICLVIERMPDRRAIRTLDRFLDDPYIKDGVTRTPDLAAEKVYPGILESRLAATLARCGARRGFDILVGYLHDVHHLLAGYAHRELASILSQDHGCDERRWQAHLDSLSFPLPAAPRQADAAEW
jgi:hypothetical protein